MQNFSEFWGNYNWDIDFMYNGLFHMFWKRNDYFYLMDNCDFMVDDILVELIEY